MLLLLLSLGPPFAFLAAPKGCLPQIRNEPQYFFGVISKKGGMPPLNPLDQRGELAGLRAGRWGTLALAHLTRFIISVNNKRLNLRIFPFGFSRLECRWRRWFLPLSPLLCIFFKHRNMRN